MRTRFAIIAMIAALTGCAPEHPIPLRVEDHIEPDNGEILMLLAKVNEVRLHEISRSERAKVPREYQSFFDAATVGDWEKALELYSGLAEETRQVAQSDPQGAFFRGLWEPIRESYYASVLLDRWPRPIWEVYLRDVLGRLPDGALLLGGTGPARFAVDILPSLGIDKEIFVVSQDHLAEKGYTRYLQYRYGERIWVPSVAGHRRILQEYLERVKTGKVRAGVRTDAGKIELSYGTAERALIAASTRAIFLNNCAKREVYVGEGLIVPWMYPHLRFDGALMRLSEGNEESMWQKAAEQDIRFWEDLSHRVAEALARDDSPPARATFAHMRAAGASLYVNRCAWDYADRALTQALKLCPSSVGANCLRARLWARQGRFGEARSILATFPGVKAHPPSSSQGALIRQARREIELLATKDDLQEKIRHKGEDLPDLLRLSAIHLELGEEQSFRELALGVLSNTNVPSETYLKLASICRRNSRLTDILGMAFERHLTRHPRDILVWGDAAVAYLHQGKTNQALGALERGIRLNGEKMRTSIRGDKRFASLREEEAFRNMVNEAEQR